VSQPIAVLQGQMEEFQPQFELIMKMLPKGMKVKTGALLKKSMAAKAANAVKTLADFAFKTFTNSDVVKVSEVPVKSCENTLTEVVKNRIFVMISRACQKIVCFMRKEKKLDGKKYSVLKILKEFRKKAGALMKPIDKHIDDTVKPIKDKINAVMKPMFNKVKQKLPQISFPGGADAVPPAPPAPKGSNPVKEYWACYSGNSKWIATSAGNLCGCCFMGSMTPKMGYTTIMPMLNLRSKLCEAITGGASQSQVPEATIPKEKHQGVCKTPGKGKKGAKSESKSGKKDKKNKPAPKAKQKKHPRRGKDGKMTAPGSGNNTKKKKEGKDDADDDVYEENRNVEDDVYEDDNNVEV